MLIKKFQQRGIATSANIYGHIIFFGQSFCAKQN